MTGTTRHWNGTTLALETVVRWLPLMLLVALGCSTREQSPPATGPHAAVDCELRSADRCTGDCRLADERCTSATTCEQIVDAMRCGQASGCEWLGDGRRGLCESAVVPCSELSADDCELAGCELDGTSCRAKDSQVPLAARAGADSSAS